MESESITELMTVLVIQLGIIFFTVRVFGKLVKKIGIPQVLGELIAGIIIGPFALGSISLPGFPHGIFPLGTGSLVVSTELYAFAMVASIILLFSSGLETDIRLFLRFSVAGSIIGLGGVVISFFTGSLLGVILFNTSFLDPRCLFLGILSTATSVGITARILSDQKKMDSPEGVTILAAAVIDDVLGIIILAMILGIIALMTGTAQSGSDLNAFAILGIAGKVFGIWLGVTALGLIFSKKIAGFLKLFRSSFDFSILALGTALILAGIFEKQGLAMIIGAYVAGLSLSKTDIAPVIKERIHGIYVFFVPVFFAVMGMMVNVRDILSPSVLIFGLIYTGVAVLAKLIGCGGPALLLGFNVKGALRIGVGMVPRGEVALIMAGIGIAGGILDQQLFSVIVLMTLITTLAAPPLLSVVLKIPGPGIRKPVADDDSISITWDYSSGEVANLVTTTLLKDLRNDGFFVQQVNTEDGISQARKDDIVFSIRRVENHLTVVTAKVDESFVRTAVHEVSVKLYGLIQKYNETSDPMHTKRDFMETEGRINQNMFSFIHPECISLNLSGVTKEEIITELVDLLSAKHTFLDRDIILKDVLEREKMTSTGMQHGIAMPHAKTDGVDNLMVAVGIKKEGVDFESADGDKSRLFILTVSPNKDTVPYFQFLVTIGAVLRDCKVREEIINAATANEAAELLRHHQQHHHKHIHKTK